MRFLSILGIAFVVASCGGGSKGTSASDATNSNDAHLDGTITTTTTLRDAGSIPDTSDANCGELGLACCNGRECFTGLCTGTGFGTCTPIDGAPLDSATTDSAKPDTGPADTGIIDTAPIDTGIDAACGAAGEACCTGRTCTTGTCGGPGTGTCQAAVDTGTVDTAPTDTGTPDTFVADTAVPDTVVIDTAVPDTIVVVDTAVPDTIVVDTAVPDTVVIDTAVPDTVLIDTAVPDTAATDSIAE